MSRQAVAFWTGLCILAAGLGVLGLILTAGGVTEGLTEALAPEPAGLTDDDLAA
jgi:hypothetical protein